MYILVHRAVLNRRNTVLSVLLSLLFTSCGLFDKDDEIQTEKIIFTDHAIESVTNLNGELDIETVVKSGYRVLYDIKIVNKLDQPIEDVSIVYNQVNGKSIIFIKDNFKRYSSAFLYGTPEELDEFFTTQGLALSIEPEGEEEEGNLLRIAMSLPLIPLEETELNSIPGAHYIQQFHVSDSTLEGIDYLINCKEIEMVPELIKEQTNIGLKSSSILISIESDGLYELIEIASNRILDESFNFSDKLISKASDQWGMRREELIDLIAIKSFFKEQNEQYAHVETQFEYYQIELENTRCMKYIVDVPEPVNEFLNMDFLEILEGKGLKINNGLNPDNVTGNYFVDNWTNLESGTRYVNYSFQFLNQTSEFQIEVKSAAEFSDATGIVAYISGDGQYFSIYSEQDHNIDDSGHTVFIKTADIYSGKVTSDGILDFQNGFIVLQKENDWYDRFLNVGDSRVVYEADFIADAVDAFPFQSTDLDPDNSFFRIMTETN
jgi:hypothetical protein